MLSWSPRCRRCDQYRNSDKVPSNRTRVDSPTIAIFATSHSSGVVACVQKRLISEHSLVGFPVVATVLDPVCTTFLSERLLCIAIFHPQSSPRYMESKYGSGEIIASRIWQARSLILPSQSGLETASMILNAVRITLPAVHIMSQRHTQSRYLCNDRP